MADLKELVLTTSGVNPLKCMRCGKCSGTCPSYDAMEYHPHQFVYMVEKGDIEKLMASKSIYTCLSCFACVERCPRDVEPAKLVEAVRLAVIRQQGQNHLKSEQIPEMLDDDLPQQVNVTVLLHQLQDPCHCRFPDLEFLFNIFLIEISVHGFQKDKFQHMLLHGRQIVILHHLCRIMPFHCMG